MDDVKENGNVTKTRVSNEQLLEKLTESNEKLVASIDIIRKEIEELKVKTGSRDKPVEPPKKENYNTDPGPWKKKPSNPEEVEQRVNEYRSRLMDMTRR